MFSIQPDLQDFGNIHHMDLKSINHISRVFLDAIMTLHGINLNWIEWLCQTSPSSNSIFNRTSLLKYLSDVSIFSQSKMLKDVIEECYETWNLSFQQNVLEHKDKNINK